MGLCFGVFFNLFRTGTISKVVNNFFSEFEPWVALETRFNVELYIKGSCASVLQVL